MKKIPSALLILVIALFLPIIVRQNYWLLIFIRIFYFGVAAYGWDNIGGYAGQISIGQAAFFAIGAYTVVILYIAFSLNVIIGIIVGAVFSGLFALILGLIVLRLKGPYFTLSTLALAEVVRILLLHFKGFTGGAEGLFLPFYGGTISTLQFRGNLPYYYIALFFLVIAITVNSYVRNSRLGYQLAALRSDNDAAESIGINLMKTKVTAYVISAVLTAFAGGFYMVFVRYVDPTSAGGMELSVEILLITLVGGRRSKWGPLLGAILLIPLIEITNAYFGDMRAGLPMLIYSIILILVVVYAPDGLYGVYGPIKKWLNLSRFKKPEKQEG